MQSDLRVYVLCTLHQDTLLPGKPLVLVPVTSVSSECKGLIQQGSPATSGGYSKRQHPASSPCAVCSASCRGSTWTYCSNRKSSVMLRLLCVSDQLQNGKAKISSIHVLLCRSEFKATAQCVVDGDCLLRSISLPLLRLWFLPHKVNHPAAPWHGAMYT